MAGCWGPYDLDARALLELRVVHLFIKGTWFTSMKHAPIGLAMHPQVREMHMSVTCARWCPRRNTCRACVWPRSFS